jgi:hypothetical protein
VLPSTSPEYVRTIIAVAGRDPSIARVLREICRLDSTVRASALDLVAAHLRARDTAGDVLECVAALRRDEIANRVAEALGPTG